MLKRERERERLRSDLSKDGRGESGELEGEPLLNVGEELGSESKEYGCGICKGLWRTEESVTSLRRRFVISPSEIE